MSPLIQARGAERKNNTIAVRHIDSAQSIAQITQGDRDELNGRRLR
ncbi:MAG: hypothetical protein AAF609_14300 [Cyanobacteria bacterium P01_C01_bin.120]